MRCSSLNFPASTMAGEAREPRGALGEVLLSAEGGFPGRGHRRSEGELWESTSGAPGRGEVAGLPLLTPPEVQTSGKTDQRLTCFDDLEVKFDF